MQLDNLYKGVVIKFKNADQFCAGTFDRIEGITAIIIQDNIEHIFYKDKYNLTWGVEKSIKVPGIGILKVGDVITPGKKIATSFTAFKHTLFIDHFFVIDEGNIWVKARNLPLGLDKDLDTKMYGKTWTR